jgi:hypothetical protein
MNINCFIFRSKKTAVDWPLVPSRMACNSISLPDRECDTTASRTIAHHTLEEAGEVYVDRFAGAVRSRSYGTGEKCPAQSKTPPELTSISSSRPLFSTTKRVFYCTPKSEGPPQPPKTQYGAVIARTARTAADRDSNDNKGTKPSDLKAQAAGTLAWDPCAVCLTPR